MSWCRPWQVHARDRSGVQTQISESRPRGADVLNWCSVSDGICALRRRGWVVLVMIVSGSSVQMNRAQRSFQASMNRSMAAMRSATVGKLPRRSVWRVKMEKITSTGGDQPGHRRTDVFRLSTPPPAGRGVRCCATSSRRAWSASVQRLGRPPRRRPVGVRHISRGPGAGLDGRPAARPRCTGRRQSGLAPGRKHLPAGALILQREEQRFGDGVVSAHRDAIQTPPARVPRGEGVGSRPGVLNALSPPEYGVHDQHWRPLLRQSTTCAIKGSGMTLMNWA
jgi:hypothetical protein